MSLVKRRPRQTATPVSVPSPRLSTEELMTIIDDRRPVVLTPGRKTPRPRIVAA